MNPKVERLAREKFTIAYIEINGKEYEEEAELYINLWLKKVDEAHDEIDAEKVQQYSSHQKAISKRVNGLLVQISLNGAWHDRRVSQSRLTWCGREIPEQVFREADRKDKVAKPHCGLCARAILVLDEQFFAAKEIEEGDPYVRTW